MRPGELKVENDNKRCSALLFVYLSLFPRIHL